jgi:hypothetical protein
LPSVVWWKLLLGTYLRTSGVTSDLAPDQV